MKNILLPTFLLILMSSASATAYDMAITELSAMQVTLARKIATSACFVGQPATAEEAAKDISQRLYKRIDVILDKCLKKIKKPDCYSDTLVGKILFSTPPVCVDFAKAYNSTEDLNKRGRACQKALGRYLLKEFDSAYLGIESILKIEAGINTKDTDCFDSSITGLTVPAEFYSTKSGQLGELLDYIIDHRSAVRSARQDDRPGEAVKEGDYDH